MAKVQPPRRILDSYTIKGTNKTIKGNSGILGKMVEATQSLGHHSVEWECQVGPSVGIEAEDHIWCSRYILEYGEHARKWRLRSDKEGNSESISLPQSTSVPMGREMNEG